VDARIVRLLGAALRLVALQQAQQHGVRRAEGLLVDRLALHPVHDAGHVLAAAHGEAHVGPHLLHVGARLDLVQHHLSPGPQRVRGIGHEVREAIAVEVGGVNQDLLLLHHVVQQDAEVRIGDVLVDLAAPVFHAGLEVLRQQGNDRVDVLLVLFVRIHRVATLELEPGPLHQPAQDAGVDGILLRLGRLGGDAADLPGLMHHLEEQARRVGHAHSRGVHLGVDDSRAAVDGELLLVLRIRQTRHEADTGDGAVGPHIAIDPGSGAQRRIGRLAAHHHLPAVLVHEKVAGRRPFDAGVVELAEPVERLQLRVVPELRHHRHAEERQPENVERHQRPVQGEHVGEGMGYGLDPDREGAAFPDNGVAIAAGLDFGALVEAVQKLEEVAVLLFLGDLEQVEGHGERGIPIGESRKKAAIIRAFPLLAV
jgi:hypothetical protein